MGYFRARDVASISTFPYNAYSRHYILGVIYTPIRDVDERRVYQLDYLQEIPSVARDFEFFFHEKFRVAADRPGSGNTRNIGSSVFEDRLLNGAGIFSSLGVEVFDDYWMNYRTLADARAEGLSQPPYRNLIEYRQHKAQGASILHVPQTELQTEAEESEQNDEG